MFVIEKTDMGELKINRKPFFKKKKKTHTELKNWSPREYYINGFIVWTFTGMNVITSMEAHFWKKKEKRGKNGITIETDTEHMLYTFWNKGNRTRCGSLQSSCFWVTSRLWHRASRGGKNGVRTKSRTKICIKQMTGKGLEIDGIVWTTLRYSGSCL